MIRIDCFVKSECDACKIAIKNITDAINKIAVDTGCLEYSRGRRNSWCSGEMLRYHEELRLRRQPAGL